MESLGALLHNCSKTRALYRGISLHAVVIKTGLKSDLVISNHVLNMYAKCGSTISSRQVFDEMSIRNLVSWSAMISGYEQSNKPLKAIQLFSQMNIAPNEFIFASTISACASLLKLFEGQQIHAQSAKYGLSSISFVANSLISMYMKLGLYDSALSVFSATSEPNSVSYNALINGFAENLQFERGFEVYKLMRSKGVIPDHFTILGMLSICIDRDDYKRGREFHCHAVKLSLDSTPVIGNVIITMYSNFKLIGEAEKAFILIRDKDVISWNTLIAACSHCDDHKMGLRVFREMIKEEEEEEENNTVIRCDEFSFASALSAIAGLASIHHGREIHAYLIRTRIFCQDVGLCNALMNMYAKCGFMIDAFNFFNQMTNRNLISWNTIIASFGNHGFGRRAVEMFEKMKEMGVKPDSVTFTGLLMACNHAGLTDSGEAYFNSIKEVYGISPNIEHFSCLIDLLGRAGRLKKAEEYIENFSFGYDSIILGSLLSSCRLHGDVEIGERMAKRILKLQPMITSPYVLLSNLYASDGMWDNVAEARKLLKDSGLKKEPGYSLIEVRGVVERFTIGDFSHSRIEELKGMLKSLSWDVGRSFFGHSSLM